MLAIASTSHARAGSGSFGTSAVNSITAGTLLMVLARIAAVALRPATVCTPSGCSSAKMRRSMPACVAAADHDEQPDEQHQQVPVDRGVDLAPAARGA